MRSPPGRVRGGSARRSTAKSAKKRRLLAPRGRTRRRIASSSDPLSTVSTAARSGTAAATASAKRARIGCRPSGPSAAHAGEGGARRRHGRVDLGPAAGRDVGQAPVPAQRRAHLEGPAVGARDALAADEVVGRDGDALDGGRAAGGGRAAHGSWSSWASRTTRRSRRARVARSSGVQAGGQGGLAGVELGEERLDEALAVAR